MASMTREMILSRKPKTLTVEIAGEEPYTVRRMTALDWERIRERDPKDQNIGLQLAMILSSEDGARLFNPDNEDDVKACADAIPLSHAGQILEAAGKISTSGSKEDVAKKSEVSTSTDSASA